MAAIILSFYGESGEVSYLMYYASHKTRAYFVNARMLKGFLVPSVIEIVGAIDIKSKEAALFQTFSIVDVL